MTQTAYRTEFDKLFIGGKWVEPSTSRVIEVYSPATGEYVGKVPWAAAADVDAAAERRSGRGPGARGRIRSEAGGDACGDAASRRRRRRRLHCAFFWRLLFCKRERENESGEVSLISRVWPKGKTGEGR